MISFSETTESPMARLKDQSIRFGRDVSDLLQAHLELAKLEAGVAKRGLIRTAILAGVAAVLAIVGLSVLTVSLAEWLAEWTALARPWWLLIVGAAAIAIGAVLALIARSKVKSDLASFDATISELREDVYWIAERLGIEDMPPR